MPAAQPDALTADAVADAVYRAVRRCATHLRPDVLAAMQAAREDETQPRAQSVLDCLLENARIGQEDGVPICQDTGTCWVRLEVGEELLIPGNILSGVNDAVARAYTDGRLRMSVAADALLDRTNTGDNTPAFAEIALRPGRGATLHVLLKGGGSDNASRVVMLAPGASWEGVKKVVLDCVREKAANACPPLIVGVGVGATFDKVAGLAKHALLREVGTPAASPQAAEREAELLSAINATGIGPAALGGGATALAVHLETAPCHIAALPVAVNMGCSAMRSASIELIDWGEMSEPVRLNLPLDKSQLTSLKAGQEVRLTGPCYTMRDAGHARALEALEQTGELPFGLAGQTLFYAGPTPAAAGRPLGSVGPTTASRMDFATPQLMRAGIAACIGKGKRNQAVIDACVENGAVYFAAVGGIAALLAKHVTASETVAWDDLGTEALRRIMLDDFPVFVAVDVAGRDLYRAIENGKQL